MSDAEIGLLGLFLVAAWSGFAMAWEGRRASKLADDRPQIVVMMLLFAGSIGCLHERIGTRELHGWKIFALTCLIGALTFVLGTLLGEVWKLIFHGFEWLGRLLGRMSWLPKW
jgi:hypothetical protein